MKVLLAIAIVVGGSAVGLWKWNAVTHQPKVMAPTEGDSPAVLSRMVTVRYDGHLWIRSALSSGDWQPVHHPDCPCGKAR